MKALSLLLGLCVLGKASMAAEPIASFAKDGLNLDLTSLPFGRISPNTGGFGPSTAPSNTSYWPTNETNMSWVTNAFTEKYHQEYPTRTLHFGVRGQEIVCLRISTITFANNVDSAEDSAAYARRKADLIQIQEALLKASPQKRFSFEDGAHSIKYMVNCSPETNSIFQQELQIAPVANRKRP